MNSSDLENTEPPKFRVWWLFALLALWIAIGLAPKLDCNPGTFGDMFGMVNSLFSGLAFLGLIHTIRLQRHEIYLQRRDLQLTRNELERSANAQADSAEALAIQVIIASISAQISTALQRRETARQAYLDLLTERKQHPGKNVVMTSLGQRPITDVIGECQSNMSSITADIDSLSARLRHYEEILIPKLDEKHRFN